MFLIYLYFHFLQLKLNQTPWEDVVHGMIVNDIALVEGDPVCLF